jgi:histidinol dehydrogenase
MQLLDWQGLDDAARRAALARAPSAANEAVVKQAQTIIDSVRRDGDAALRALARQFDGIELGALQVTDAEFAPGGGERARGALAALQKAIANVRLSSRATARRARTRDAAGRALRAHLAPAPLRRIVRAGR